MSRSLPPALSLFLLSPAGCASPAPDTLVNVIPTPTLSVFVVSPDRALEPSDRAVTRALSSALGRVDTTVSRDVDVQVRDGIATLRGEVDHLLLQQHVEEVATNIRGIRAVINEVEVRPSDKDDRRVALDVEAAIADIDGVESFDVDVEVDHGVAHLRGVVRSLVERGLAARAARSVRGVTAVEDEMRVVHATDRSDEEIREELSSALDASFDGDTFEVGVDDGRVSIVGRVPTIAALRRVVALAAAAGAHHVDAGAVEVSPTMRHHTSPTEPSDETLARAVVTAMAAVPIRSKVTVDVNGGDVSLSGGVAHAAARRMAVEAAENVVGVNRVVDRLEVGPSPIAARDKEGLARDRVRRLGMRGDHRVDVVDDVAMLSGTIMSAFERDILVRELEAIEGIRRVSTDGLDLASPVDLTARPQPKGEQLRYEIEAALLNSSFVQVQDVAVLVDGNRVTLVGDVGDERSIAAAEDLARRSGAEDVVTLLAVAQR